MLFDYLIHMQENNFAFIDAQNLNLGVKSLGWRLDYKRFRIYLKEKYQVSAAYFFIGYSLCQHVFSTIKEIGKRKNCFHGKFES